MLLVIGNTPKKVELKDLNDCVYYKQQKVFSEDQYRRSQDLQRALSKGSVTLLERTNEKDGAFDIPTFLPFDASKPVPQASSADNGKIDALLDRINRLESIIRNQAIIPNGKSDSGLVDKIEELEKKIAEIGSGPDSDKVTEAIRRLEEKIEGGSKNNDIFDRLERILERAPQGTAASPKRPVRPEDIYVPNLTVEDGNSHIKLNTRTVEKSDNVNDALRKLKELKSKST